MSTVRLRPTFRVVLGLGRDQAIAEIRDRLAADERFAGRWRGKGRWAEIHVPHRERRVWSPHLSLRLDQDEGEGRCTLFGRFAPDPEVWTFCVFLWVAGAFAAVFGAVLGWVQWVSGDPPLGAWPALGGAGVIVLVHLAGALGQRLGQAQMRSLHDELDGILAGLDAEGGPPARGEGSAYTSSGTSSAEEGRS